MPRKPRPLIQKLQHDYDLASVKLRAEIARLFPPGSMVECMGVHWGPCKVIGPSGLYSDCLQVEKLGHVRWDRLVVVGGWFR